MKDLVKIELPFSGFYDSLNSEKIDDELAMAFSDDRGDLRPKYQDTIWEAPVDYKAIHQEYAKAYTEDFGKEFDLDIRFDEMTSPAFYNFSTDRVFATIPRDQINKIRREVEAMPEYAGEIKERFTNYSGFISHYSNDAQDEDWTRPTLDECQYQVILEIWLGGGEKAYDKEIEICMEIELWGLDSFNEAVTAIEKFTKEHKQGVKK